MERDVFSKEVSELKNLKIEKEISDTQLSYETPRERLEKLYKKYDRPQLATIFNYYLTKEQKNQVLTERKRRIDSWSSKGGLDKIRYILMQKSPENFVLQIVKDFLESGQIKTNNGIPIPLEKNENIDIEKIKRNIRANISLYTDAMTTGLELFNTGMKEIPESTNILPAGTPLPPKSVIDDVLNALKYDTKNTIFKTIGWALEEFVPLSGIAKHALKGSVILAKDLFNDVKTKQLTTEEVKVLMKQQQQTKRFEFFNELTEFFRIVKNLVNRRVEDILITTEKDSQLKTKQNQQNKNAWIFLLRTLEMETLTLIRKNSFYFQALLCAGWIKSTFEEEPDNDLKPQFQKKIIHQGKSVNIKTKGGHLKLTFSFYVGNLADRKITAEVRAWGGRQLSVMLNTILKQKQTALEFKNLDPDVFIRLDTGWFMPTIYELPVPKIIYFDFMRNPIQNYIQLDHRNNIVDFNSRDPSLGSFVREIMDEDLYDQIKKNGGLKNYVKDPNKSYLKVSTYWRKFLPYYVEIKT